MMHTIALTNKRSAEGGFLVYFDNEYLDPEPSLKLRNHSPDGFAYGYMGSGPSQLALALLLMVTTPEIAVKHYMDFKTDYVSKWKASIQQVDIEEWLQNKER